MIDSLKLIILLNQVEIIEDGLQSKLLIDEKIFNSLTTLMKISADQFRAMLCNRISKVGKDTLIIENSQ